MTTPKADLWPHIIQLRALLLRYLSVFTLLCLPFLYFASEWFAYLSGMLQTGYPLIATSVAAPFTVPLKVALFSTLFLTLPYAFYLVWTFISEGLYPSEQRLLYRPLLLSIALFYLGSAMAFFIVCPMAMRFFAHIAPEGVAVMTDIHHYLNFSLSLMWGFGIAFQTPVFLGLAIQAGWLSVEQLRLARPYCIVLAFVFGMLLTPPDVLSQVLLALPLWGLFEITLLTASHKQRQARQKLITTRANVSQTPTQE